LGPNGAGVKFVIENAIFGIIDPGFAYSLCNLYGATIMIKGSLLLSIATVKRFTQVGSMYS